MKRVFAAVAVLATAIAMLMMSSLAANASTVNVDDLALGLYNDGYIGDQLGSWSTLGDDPLAPGDSRVYTVNWWNAGDEPTTFDFTQEPGQWVFGTAGPSVPASWVTFGVTQSDTVLPGEYVSVKVTLTVPADTPIGLYTGLAMGTTTGGGAGAGLRSPTRVPPSFAG